MKFTKEIEPDKKLAIIIILCFIIFVGFFRVLSPGLDHWLNCADAEALISAKNFSKFGFLNCYFLPILSPQVEAPTGFYTHYPPLSNIIAGAIMKFFPNASLSVFRIIPLFFAAFASWFWFLLLRRFMSKTYLFPFLGVLFFVTNSLFILSADSIHQFSYMEFSRSAILFYFVLFLEDKKKLSFVLLLLLLFLNILFSFEYVFYVFLFFGLYSIFFQKKLLWRYWILMITVVVCGFLLHFFQNALALGGVHAAFSDLFNAAAQRMGKSWELGGTAPTLRLWFAGCFLRNIQLIGGQANKLFLFLPLVIYFVSVRKNEDKKAAELWKSLKLLLIFFLCGLVWWIVFPSHSLVHVHTAIHMLLMSAMLSACVLYSLIYFSEKIRFRALKYLARVFVIIFIISLLISNVMRSDLPLADYNRMSKDHFKQYSSVLAYLGKMTKLDEKIYSNYWNVSIVKYYSNRNCDYIATCEQLKSIRLEHRYFIFFFTFTRESKELFDYLMQHYQPILDGYVTRSILPRDAFMKYVVFKKNKFDNYEEK